MRGKSNTIDPGKPLLELRDQLLAGTWCLGSLDTLITEQAKKLGALKTHKQGLMQGLFPSPEVSEWEPHKPCKWERMRYR
jgi:hypothetical protein